jgi:tetratricopeptide (TPR) repeat protein
MRFFWKALKTIVLIIMISGFVQWYDQQVFADDVSDRLLMIKGGYKDGLMELVRSEAAAFLEHSPNHPEAPEVALILGLIEKKSGQNSLAVKHLNSALKSPDHHITGQAAYELGCMSWTEKKYDTAAVMFGKAGRLATDSTLRTQSRLWEGISLYHADQPDAAVEVFDRFIRDEDGVLTPKAFYFRGLSYLETDHFAKGAEDFEKVFTFTDKDLKLNAALAAARSAIQADDLDTADYWCSRALRLGQNGQLYYLRGQIAFKLQRWQAAASCLSKESIALLEDTDKKDAAYLLAVSRKRDLVHQNADWWVPLLDYVSHYDTRRNEIIRELMNVSAAPLPEHVVDYIVSACGTTESEMGDLIANAYLQAGAPSKALHWVTRMLFAADSADPTPMLRLAVVKMMQLAGDSDEAIDELNNLIKMEVQSSDTGTLTVQADLLFQAERYDQAAALYLEWMISQPESTQIGRIKFWLGESYYRLHRWRLAVRAFEAAELDDSTPDMYREVAVRRLLLCQFNLFDWPGMIETSHRYIDQYDREEFAAEVLFYQGLAHANLGNFDAALNVLSSSLDRMEEAEYLEIIKETIRRIENLREEWDPGDNKNPIANLSVDTTFSSGESVRGVSASFQAERDRK